MCWVCVAVVALGAIGPAACRQATTELSEREIRGREAELTRLQRLLRDGEGDTERGQHLFAARCGNCHQLDQVGRGEVGGELADHELASDDPDALLERIAFPDPDEHPYHTMFELHTEQGHAISGVLAELDADTVELVNVAGDTIELEREQITSLSPAYRTLTPGHLLTAMTDQQVLDLFAFLLNEHPSPQQEDVSRAALR